LSLRYEQYWSLKKTREFLYSILKDDKFTKKELKNNASRCVKHFPILDKQGQPYWSKDEFTRDRE